MAQSKRQTWYEKRALEMAEAWGQFHEAVFESGKLDRKTKELIAAVVATVNRCRHCTQGHIQAAQEEGASKDEVSEALMVASFITSATQLSWMIKDYTSCSVNAQGHSSWGF